MKFLLLIALFFSFVSCVPEVAPEPVNTGLTIEEIEAYLEKHKERRDNTLREFRTDECSEDSDCRATCRDIYRTRGESKECESLSIKKVKDLEEIHEELENPSFSDLEKIRHKDLEVYLDVGISGLNKHVSKWSKSQVKALLSWIAHEDRIADILRSRDDDSDFLKDLLEEFGQGNSNSEKYLDALQRSLTNGDSFLEIAIEATNEEALDWVHDFMENEEVGSCGEGDIETVNCLYTYCDIASSMSEKEADKWLEFDYFEGYIENIIDEEVNGSRNPSGSQWDTNDITSINEVGDWWKDLC